MKEAIVAKGPKVQIIDSEIPKPGPKDVVIKVVYSGSNPKDWKLPEWAPELGDINQGDDIAGTVHAVGADVTQFKPGDRVAAFHEMTKPHGSYAEYALSWASTTFHLPKHVSFEEGAAIPLAAMTAAVGLFAELRLPQPFTPAPPGSRIPLVIYGASSAVGYYAVQLAIKANIHPLICIAGRASSHVEQLLDRSAGDTIVDYRPGSEAVVSGLRDALHGARLEHAFDAVSEHGSYQNIAKVLDEKTGRITFVLPGREYEGFAETVTKSITRVGDVHGTPNDKKDFGYVYFRYFSRGLDDGWFKAQPQEVLEGGLDAVQQGLENLRDGKASAVKYIFRVADTRGAGQ